MRSSSDSDAALYLKALKELLKERGVTYRQLADGMRCSLPTVKRALNKTSLPFNRLLELCEIAAIPFGDLSQRTEMRRPTHYVFDATQDRLFAERSEILAYFLELAKGAAPSDIAEKHDLDSQSTDVYLKHLARVGLVERRSKNRVRLVVTPPVGFGPRSLVLRKQHAEFLREIVSTVLETESDTTGRFAVLKIVHLSDQDYNQMLADLENIVDRYAALAERGLSKGSTTGWQIALACGPAPERPHVRLPRIKR